LRFGGRDVRTVSGAGQIELHGGGTDLDVGLRGFIERTRDPIDLHLAMDTRGVGLRLRVEGVSLLILATRDKRRSGDRRPIGKRNATREE
jgi:hypothetical protein